MSSIRRFDGSRGRSRPEPRRDQAAKAASFGYLEQDGRSCLKPAFQSGGEFSEGLEGGSNWQPYGFKRPAGNIRHHPQFDKVG